MPALMRQMRIDLALSTSLKVSVLSDDTQHLPRNTESFLDLGFTELTSHQEGHFSPFLIHSKLHKSYLLTGKMKIFKDKMKYSLTAAVLFFNRYLNKK